MADPVRKRLHADDELESYDDDALRGSSLQRWIERPDGSMKLLNLPLTPELFLNPQLEDKMTQGELHADLMAELKELLGRHFKPRRDVKVLMDMMHLLGPGLPTPSPDISIVQGVRYPDRKRDSFSLAREGIVPSLIIEIISPLDPRIRRVDEVDKVALYQKVRVPEYMLVNTPRNPEGAPISFTGYRLATDRRYRPLEPDAQGRLLSETTELLFGVSADASRIEVYDARTGERLSTPDEAVAKAARAEAARKREVAARKAAEEELERLRAEIERLRR